MYDSTLLGQSEFVRDKMKKHFLSLADEIKFSKFEKNQYNCNLNKKINTSAELSANGNIDFDEKAMNNTPPPFSLEPASENVETDFWNMTDDSIVTYKLNQNFNDYADKFWWLEDYIETDDYCFLENPTLIKDGKIIFSYCTHEGYVFIDENYKNQIESHYKDVVKSDPLFKFALDKFNQSKTDKSFIFNPDELTILNQLNSYIDQAQNKLIYIVPNFECNEYNFKKIAEKYLPASVTAPLNILNNFAEFNINNLSDDYFNICFYLSNIEEFV